MTETDFKAGDRVRLIKAVGGLDVPVGTVGTVNTPTRAMFPFINVNFGIAASRSLMCDDEMELVPAEEPKFKVGDRVRYVGPGYTFAGQGCEAVITKITAASTGPRYRADWTYRLMFGDGEEVTANLGAYASELELVQPAEEPKPLGTRLVAAAKEARAIASTPSFTRDLSLTPGSKVVLLHLKKRGSISPAEAFTTYNTLRLAPRIHELRQAGYAIKTEMREDERGHKYARYSLAA